MVIFEKKPLKEFLSKDIPWMHPDVIDKVMSILECQKNMPKILTVIDFSLPSNYKRLWILDLKNQKLLYHTHVAHGLLSGEKDTLFFSNLNQSKQSSLGVYQTGHAYFGREGISLTLEGLEPFINDQVNRRAIVVHGGHYVEEAFIKKYGRAGRSWGCFAIPQSKSKEMIQTIKNHQLLISYYPNDQWFLKSRFLNCHPYSLKPAKHVVVRNVERPQDIEEKKQVLLMAPTFKKYFQSESAPLLTVSADDYQMLFRQPPPLNRMLRRSIETKDYIALNLEEFTLLSQRNPDNYRQSLHFIIPTTGRQNGRYKTLMKMVDLGVIEQIDARQHVVKTNKHLISLTTHSGFIRWLGL